MTKREIKRLRKSLGLTQEQFAHRLGVTVKAVNRWENGHAKPTGLSQVALMSVKANIEKELVK